MSASDKKQQRKAALVDGMTQKQLREQQEAQRARRNRIIYTVIGIVCAVAATALLVWNALQGRVNTGAVAATVDGTNYTVADLQYYYTEVKNNEAYLAQPSAYYGFSYSNYDYTVDEGAQWYDQANGLTYADHFRQEALEQLSQVHALCAAAKEAGYTLSSDGEAKIQEQLQQIDLTCAQNGLTRSAYFKQVFGKGVTETVFTRNLRNDILADEYQTYHQENLTYDDADLEAYYAEHAGELDSFDYMIFPISGAAETTTDAEGNTVNPTDEEKAAAMAAAKEKAEAAVDEVNAVELSERQHTFAHVAQEYVDETARAAYADEDYSLVTGVTSASISTSAISSWLLETGRKPGDVAALEATERYYVVLFLNRYRNDAPTVDFRHILVSIDTTGGTIDEETGYTIPTEEATVAAWTEAQAIYDEWKAGEATEDSFAALANEKSTDTGSNTRGGLYTAVTQGYMVPPIDGWIYDDSRQPGDTTIVEYLGHYTGVHIVYFVGTNDPTWKGTALSALQSSAQTTWLTGLTDAVTAEVKDGMKDVGSVNTAVATATPAPAEGE